MKLAVAGLIILGSGLFGVAMFATQKQEVFSTSTEELFRSSVASIEAEAEGAEFETGAQTQESRNQLNKRDGRQRTLYSLTGGPIDQVEALSISETLSRSWRDSGFVVEAHAVDGGPSDLFGSQGSRSSALVWSSSASDDMQYYVQLRFTSE